MRHDVFWPGVLCVGFFLMIASAYLSHVLAADLPTSIFISICGDGIIQPGELCDDGAANNLGAYGSSISQRHCAPGCESYGPYCGDGVLEVRFGESCDDGNNISGDLCSATCTAETAVPPGASGSPTVGSIPQQSLPPGQIPSALETKVVLHGKAYPGASIDILLDGIKKSTVAADANADFLYSSTDVTPGVTTFSFIATDDKGTQSFTSSATFDVVQSAVTTVSNIFIPPTIRSSATQVDPGTLLTLSGQSVPNASLVTQLSDAASSTLNSQTDGSGDWALQIDTGSLSIGYHAAKSYFELSSTSKSGFGRAVNFYVGKGNGACGASKGDLNGDGKVNLVDFSIMLTVWQKSNANADLNCDGTVGLADFSILLFNWTG